VWDALAAHRWYPPTSKRVTTDRYELAVTPGAPGLSWIYGLTAGDDREASRLLDEIRPSIESVGGTGARIWVTPKSQPGGLRDLLVSRGFKSGESVEVLVWDLRDDQGNPRLPSFTPLRDGEVREITTESDSNTFQDVMATIFEYGPPSVEVRAGFNRNLDQTVRQTGHSNQFLAFEGARAIGCAGLGLSGAVAMLWGAGVLPEYRGRGFYGELVNARCESATERGSEIAVVTARTGTSGPILKRHGFRVVGPIEIFEAQWSSPEGRPPSPV